MRTGRAISLFLIFCYSLLVVSGLAHAQSADEANYTRWGVTLDWVELELDKDEVVTADFNRYKARLGALIDDAEQFKAGAIEALEAPRLEDVERVC